MERVILFATGALSLVVVVIGAKIKVPTVVDWEPCVYLLVVTSQVIYYPSMTSNPCNNSMDDVSEGRNEEVVCTFNIKSSEDAKINEKQVGVIKQIRIYGNCTDRCQLKINSSVEFEVDFDPGEDTDNLAPEMSGLLGPIEIPFPGMRTSVCDSVFTSEGETCPLKKGKFYTYRRAVPIKDEYPPILIDIKWKLLTDKKHTSVCFIVKSQLVE